MRRRKNLIPMLFLAVVCWVGVGYLIYAVSPNRPLPTPLPIDSKTPFFLLLFLTLFFSLTLLFNNTRRGFLVALGLTALVLLRFFKFFHPLYIVLVLAILFTVELFFAKK